MIKKILLGLLLLFIFFQTALSQDGKKYIVSSGLLLNQMPETIRAAWVNDIGLLKNNNLFKFGIITQVYTDNAESLSESIKISGGHLGYGRIVITNEMWLALELKSDINIQYFKSAWKSNFYIDELQQYQEYEYMMGEILIDLSAGYGLRINVSQNFFISQSFTGGLFYSQINSDELSSDAPEIKDSDLDFRSYGNTGFQWNVQLGLGYTFGK